MQRVRRGGVACQSLSEVVVFCSWGVEFVYGVSTVFSSLSKLVYFLCLSSFGWSTKSIPLLMFYWDC